MMYNINGREWEFLWSPFRLKESTPSKNCRIIEKKLCENGIKANVTRHTLFGNKYFLVNNPKKGKCLDENDISDALDIPDEWVNLYCMYESRETYAVDENKLIEEYGDCNGLLSFEEFDLIDCIRTKGAKGLSAHLKKHNLSSGVVNLYRTDDMILIKKHMGSFSAKAYSDVLNIPLDAIVDVSNESNEFEFIILTDRCK